MDERYDLKELLREIEEDEKDNASTGILTQEAILQLMRKRQTQRSSDGESQS